MSDSTFIRALERMNYKGKMTGHGFRTVFLGVAKEKLNYSHEIPDRQLAHVPKGTNGKAYDRATLLPQRTKLMQAFADYIDKISKHRPTQRSNDGQSQPTYQFTYVTNYSINWISGTSQPTQQYQYIHPRQPNTFGGHSEARQKWSPECVDGSPSKKIH